MNNRRVYSFIKLFLALSTFILTGCGTVDLEIRQTNTNTAMQPRSVAILPFTLEEPVHEKVSPNDLFRTCFYNYFSFLGYIDVPLEVIDLKLSKAGLTENKKILEMSPEKLREILGVDAVIRGRVLSANNFTGGIHAEALGISYGEPADVSKAAVLAQEFGRDPWAIISGFHW